MNTSHCPPGRCHSQNKKKKEKQKGKKPEKKINDWIPVLGRLLAFFFFRFPFVVNENGKENGQPGANGKLYVLMEWMFLFFSCTVPPCVCERTPFPFWLLLNLVWRQRTSRPLTYNIYISDMASNRYSLWGDVKTNENTTEKNVVNGLFIYRENRARLIRYPKTKEKKKRIFSCSEQTKKQVIDFYINSYGLSFSIFSYFAAYVQQHLYLYSLVRNG